MTIEAPKLLSDLEAEVVKMEDLRKKMVAKGAPPGDMARIDDTLETHRMLRDVMREDQRGKRIA